MLDLQALIREMYIFISRTEVVLVPCRSHISFLVKKNLTLFCDEHPNSNIKFSTLVQQRTFNILLNDPFRAKLLGIYKHNNIFQSLEHLNTLALIKICWLYYPHIVLAVLGRCSLSREILISDLIIPIHKFFKFSIIMARFYNISSADSIMDLVVSSSAILIEQVVTFKSFY